MQRSLIYIEYRPRKQGLFVCDYTSLKIPRKNIRMERWAS